MAVCLLNAAVYLYLFRVCFCNHHFYFPAQLVGGFTLSDLLDKPWSQVSSLLPPGTCLNVSVADIGLVYLSGNIKVGVRCT